MAAKPKLTPGEWASVRNTWESDPREGYTWLIDELSIPMTRAGLRKVALREVWTKKVLSDNVKVSNSKVSKVSQTAMGSKVSNDDGSDTMNDEPDTIEDAGSGSVGRPTSYIEKYNKQAYRLCLLGAIDDELAEFFEVSVSTITNWKNEHPEFLASIKKGKIAADSKVAERLYERAMGYSHPEIHVSNYMGAITKTELTKHYPPDTVAAFIWLKNRQPEKWRDKIEVGVNVKLDRETLVQIEQVFMEKMTQARERQKAISMERGILIEHGQD